MVIFFKLNETELEYELPFHLTFIFHSIYLNITMKEAHSEGWKKKMKNKRKERKEKLCSLWYLSHFTVNISTEAFLFLFISSLPLCCSNKSSFNDFTSQECQMNLPFILQHIFFHRITISHSALSFANRCDCFTNPIWPKMAPSYFTRSSMACGRRAGT